MELLVQGAVALGIRLDRGQIDRFHQYYMEIDAWNSRVNLTTITGWEQVQTRHFLESLAVSATVPMSVLRSAAQVMDIGSGAGLPGLPLKIAFPGLRVTLMDATAKKTEFLAHVAHELGLDDVEVRTGRAEELAHDIGLREGFDLVLARGVARLSVLAELTLPFCRLGGLAIAHKRVGIDGEIRDAYRAIEAVGGRMKEVREVPLGASGESDPLGQVATALVVLEKMRPTPERYPRRPGIPAKRPL